MANCLITTLSEAVDNSKLVAPDEFIIKVNHIDNSITAAARYIAFTFRDSATVRMADDTYSFQDANGNSIGSVISFAVNAGQTLYFPNPAAGKSYDVIVSNKYALGQLNTQEYPTEQYNFFEFDLSDLRYCAYLDSLRCMCHKVTGSLKDLERSTGLDYIQIGRTGVTGDLADLKKMPYLRAFKGSPCDVHGDIAAIKDLPMLRQFEVGNCLEVYGNLSALQNHTSINYLVFPQVQSHPAIEGDIANLSGCTSLGYISATNESKIYGDISAFTGLSSLYIINFNGTRVSGDIAAFSGMTNLEQINLGAPMSETYFGADDDKVYGDIADLSNLTRLYTVSLQLTGVTGDVGDLENVPRLSSLYLANTAVVGEMEDFSPAAMPNLINLDVSNCVGITGDVASLAGHSHLQTLRINGTNATGDIGEALEDCTTLTAVNINNTSLSGDITKVFKDTAMQTGSATGCANLEGDLSGLPDNFYLFSSNGRSGATFSWSASDARPASSSIISFDNVDFGEDLEKMLINQASCTPGGNQMSMNVWGSGMTATTMSAACRAACETLAGMGCTIYVNGVLVAAAL